MTKNVGSMNSVLQLLDQLSLSSSGGSGGGSSSDSGTRPNSSGRHNVGRIPELDYFARKAAPQKKGSGGGQAAEWGLPFGKAGQAGPLPDVHAGPEAFLTSMQAHTALEFQASASKALEQAEGKYPEPAQKWWRFGRLSDSTWRALPTRGQNLDFSDEGDSWMKHLVHVKETDSFHLARRAQREDNGDDVLVLLPTVECGAAVREMQARSLGYMGSFLLQYSSAQTLRFQLHAHSDPLSRSAALPHFARSLRLLELAADPSKQLEAGGSSGGQGTLRGGPVALFTNIVPINAGQRAAVVGLRGGLSIVHGPPGTGKSTTIYHIIEGRVQAKAQVLVTCTRNQAIDAVVEKLTRVRGGLLVFGREQRLGDKAKLFTLKARTERDPDVVFWLDQVTKLQALREEKAPSPKAVGRALSAVVAGGAHGARAEDLASLRRLQESACQGAAASLKDAVLQPAITRILGKVLPAAKEAAKQRILRDTRVYACTVDSTPRMVYELEEHQVVAGIDTVIIDEAGCVSEMALPVLIKLAPSNLVLIGDHLQLPAFTDLVSAPANHCRSLMERAVVLGPPAVLLTEQYRMHPSICAAISREFYGHKLLTAAPTAARRAVAVPCRMVHVAGWEKRHEQGGYSNEKEAAKVISVALKAAADVRGIGIHRPSVYLVSMYNRQREMIDRLVQKTPEGAKLRACCDCQVLSIDACQGDEADVVVVSTVRNVFASKLAQNLSGFFRGRQRINVAMSRARHVSAVVGSRKTLRLPKARPWGAVLADYEGFA